MDVNVTQQKRADKIGRLRSYFRSDQPEIYEWHPKLDEAIDFKAMTDKQVEDYLDLAKSEGLS